jgi:Domain of unknown function (DUF3846)
MPRSPAEPTVVIIIDPTGSVVEATPPHGAVKWDLADFQSLVGGYVEVVRLPGNKSNIALVNEDGYALGLAPNHAATAALGLSPVVPLLGTVVVVPATAIR